MTDQELGCPRCKYNAHGAQTGWCRECAPPSDAELSISFTERDRNEFLERAAVALERRQGETLDEFKARLRTRWPPKP